MTGRPRGRQGGRSRKLDDVQAAELAELFRAREIPVTQLAARFGIHRTSVYRYAAAAAVTGPAAGGGGGAAV